jgi:predicted nucleic acid-binding protein
MIIVDTDILIWILRGRKEVIERFKNLAIEYNGHIFITPVQVSEIHAGLRETEKERINSFLRTLKTVIIDYEIGRLAGEFMRQFKKSHNVTIADSLIAASARVNSFKLWTLNRKHYPMLSHEEFIE